MKLRMAHQISYSFPLQFDISRKKGVIGRFAGFKKVLCVLENFQETTQVSLRVLDLAQGFHVRVAQREG